MALPPLPLGLSGPPSPQSMEHTPSDPLTVPAGTQLDENDQQRLLALVRRYKDQWSQDRRVLMQRCLQNLEFFKGNQFISFGPGETDFFNAVDWMNEDGHADDSDDKDLYQYCSNFYQMLATGFVAILAPQVPKSKWMPEDAEQLADVTTARAAQTLIGIIEAQNHEQAMLRQQLLYLYTTGAAFRHTRYVVDGERAGMSRQPLYAESETMLAPDRFHCFACGTTTLAAHMAVTSRACPECDRPLDMDSFFPAEYGSMVRKVGEEAVPNGMVAQNIYSPLEVDCDQTANTLRQTPILNLEVEVHLGALRASYPAMYDQIQASASSELSSNGSIDRIARQQVYAQTGLASSILEDQRPTLSRTWVQPWAFDLEDDQEFGQRMRALYPSGLLMVSTGPTFLSAREACLAREWTWAGTHEGFGMYPPSIGDVVVPFQKRYNDMANILHEFMDRCSSGVTLANADLIDTKSLQGKPMLPGVLNLVKLRRTGAPGAARLADALYQFQFQMHEEAFAYLDKLAFNAQMFAGIPPQLYGGTGDPSITTFGGQQQQLTSALGKLNIYWENLKEEHAQADELAVECAQENLTADMRKVVMERGSAFRNDYIRLDDLQGDVHAISDSDQGLPVTAGELRQRWTDLMQAAGTNPLAQAIFDDPANQEQAASALGVPNMVVPGSAMRSKVLQMIDRLLQAEAVPVVSPQTGLPTGQVRPTILPDKGIDDLTVLKQVVRQYCQENSDLPDKNPSGWQNLLAYFKAAVAMETQEMAEQAAAKRMVDAAGNPAGPVVPQEEIDDVVRTVGGLMHLDPSATKGSVSGQVAAANALIKLGEKLQG